MILSVAIDREKCWKLDHETALKYGIMHYAENGGPGGLMHTARNIALVMPILRDIEDLCPDAWVLNFTNPVPRICIAAARYTCLKMVGICHQLSFGYMMAGRLIGRDLGMDVPSGYLFRWDGDWDIYEDLVQKAEERLDITAAGINHFTWMLSVRDRHNGEDLYPLLRERFLKSPGDFEPLTREIFDIFKACPVPGDCHLVEYLPYTHSAARGTWGKYDIQMYPLDAAEKSRENMWEDIKAMVEGRMPIDHLRSVHTERAELIIGAIKEGRHSYEPAVNIPNRGYVQNLPEGAIVEVPADISSSGIHGIGIGKLPEAAAELCRRQISIAETAVEACVKGSREKALQALMLDPMIDDPRTAGKLLDEYLNTQKDYIPQFFK